MRPQWERAQDSCEELLLIVIGITKYAENGMEFSGSTEFPLQFDLNSEFFIFLFPK